jgi:putative transposase
MRFAFIARHKAVWQIRQLCNALQVTRGGFYEWLKRPQSARGFENEKLLGQIRTSFELSDSTYGSPRVWREVNGWGCRSGIHRVARLMRLADLKARKARRTLPFDTGVRPEHAIAPNHLDREFHADAPNKRWVADFTYIWTAEGWLYFAVVLDLFSRRVVGWSMRKDMTAELVTDALVMALWRRGRPKELMHHSDQGSQYTSEQCQKLLADSGVACSMSRRGDCWDNAAMESFFASLKKERVHRRNYATRDEARADLFDYVERFYNQRRLHSTIGYMSPAAYEASVGLR